MFLIEEIRQVFENERFKEDFAWVKQALLLKRFGRTMSIPSGAIARLAYLVESTLASAPSWDGNEAIDTCKLAAEIAELLSTLDEVDRSDRGKLALHASLLYELGNMPALASAVLDKDDQPGLLDDALRRDTPFSSLLTNGELEKVLSRETDQNESITDRIISEDIVSLLAYEQGRSDLPEIRKTDSAAALAQVVNLDRSSSELEAISAVIHRRTERSTRFNIEPDLFDVLREVHFPSELWPTQIEAVKGGLTEDEFSSWGFAAPTGTGKTLLARLLIVHQLLKNPDNKILYVVPTRALVHEVTQDLNTILTHLQYQAVSVTPQLVSLDNEEESLLTMAAVAVLTPEKADLLLRLKTFINEISLIVIDEAHHIENGTRGALLELYLWRIRKLFSAKPRFVFLSAVAPNIKEIAGWLGGYTGAVVAEDRATRMRAGVYRLKKGDNGRYAGIIDYSDGTSIEVVESKPERTQQKGIIQLAAALASAGPVLIVAKGKRTSETLAKLALDWLSERGIAREHSPSNLESPEFIRLDSRLEREMYSSVPMRQLIKYRIAYHHAGLPPRVRVAVEAAIKTGLIDYVFATTTLAEGVNFPFSSVVVQSLALQEPPEKGKPRRYNPVTPRSYWNIAGRAGRPGYDREGQVILFEPSLGLDKVELVLDEFLDPAISRISPVGSALAAGLKQLHLGIEAGTYSISELRSPVLPDSLSRGEQGIINLIRVGLVHARAEKLIQVPEEILEGSFAKTLMAADEEPAAVEILRSQVEMLNDFFARADAPSPELVAELGLSIETLTDLMDYVTQLENWQLESMQNAMYGGAINFDQARFVVGPVAKRMSELEGGRLGGFLSDVILNWMRGLPLTRVKALSNLSNSFEDLVAVIYSRVQYLLPWGLFAFHRLVENECVRRKITTYNDSILSLAYLSDAGVPNFNALRLVGLDFERVDATRLSYAYQESKASSIANIFGWLKATDRLSLYRIVRGADNRRMDYDFDSILDSV